MEAEKQEKVQGQLTEAQLEAQVASRQRAREVKELHGDDGDDRIGPELLKAAASEEKLTETEIVSALDHFLATEDDAEETIEPVDLKLNLGTKDDKRWVRWAIVPVEDTEITRIRKDSVKGTRAQRRRGDAETDEALVSRKLLVLGTVDPDPKELARTMGMLDPVDAIQAYFKKYGKTGLITQVSGEILSISGWDDEDVQEVEAARG